MKECCKDFCLPEGYRSKGKNHNKNCPNYKTEKFIYLMYYEEALNYWTFVPEEVEGGLICTEDQLDDGEKMDISFKRVDLTDKEYDEIPVE